MAWASLSFSVSSSYTAVAPMSSGPTGFWKARTTCDNSRKKGCTREKALGLSGGSVTEQVLGTACFTLQQFLTSLSTCQHESSLMLVEDRMLITDCSQVLACKVRTHWSPLYSFKLHLVLAGNWSQLSHVQRFSHEAPSPHTACFIWTFNPAACAQF